MTGTLVAHWVGLNFVIQMQDDRSNVIQHVSLSGYEWEQVKKAAEDEEALRVAHEQGDGRPVRCAKCTSDASYTNSVVDVSASTETHTAYKKVPLCVACAMEARESSTSRIEQLEV